MAYETSRSITYTFGSYAAVSRHVQLHLHLNYQYIDLIDNLENLILSIKACFNLLNFFFYFHLF